MLDMRGKLLEVGDLVIDAMNGGRYCIVTDKNSEASIEIVTITGVLKTLSNANILVKISSMTEKERMTQGNLAKLASIKKNLYEGKKTEPVTPKNFIEGHLYAQLSPIRSTGVAFFLYLGEAKVDYSYTRAGRQTWHPAHTSKKKIFFRFSSLYGEENLFNLKDLTQPFDLISKEYIEKHSGEIITRRSSLSMDLGKVDMTREQIAQYLIGRQFYRKYRLIYDD